MNLDSYAVASGQTMYIGRAAPPTEPQFDSIIMASEESSSPWSQIVGRPLVVELHGSSGSNSTQGRQYRAQVSGNMEFGGFTEFGFSVAVGYRSVSGSFIYHARLCPIDRWVSGGTPRESMHMGFIKASDSRVYLVSEHRYDAMMDWALANLSQYNLNKRVLTGGSMGGWGSITYGVRRHDMFAAIYPDRPRWRYSNILGNVEVASLASGGTNYPIDSAPLLSADDGATSYAAHVDLIAYVSNTANKVRPILWCCGKQDGFSLFSDQIAAVNALRAGKRAFAFAWNNGNHSTGSIMEQIFQSYPFGTYDLTTGYPLFTEHSLDQDPAADDVGGINIGLSFDQVAETANSWSCRVTNVLGPCTVKVEPISDVFKAAVVPTLVTIPAAGTFVAVSFTA